MNASLKKHITYSHIYHERLTFLFKKIALEFFYIESIIQNLTFARDAKIKNDR